MFLSCVSFRSSPLSGLLSMRRMIAAASPAGSCSCAEEKDVGLVGIEVSAHSQYGQQVRIQHLGVLGLPAVGGLDRSAGDGCKLERSLSTAFVVAVSSLGTCATSSLIWTTLASARLPKPYRTLLRGSDGVLLCLRSASGRRIRPIDCPLRQTQTLGLATELLRSCLPWSLI